MRTRNRVLALVLATIFVASLPVAAKADHDDGFYEMPAIASWNETRLTTLVIPPNHGQIWNEDAGILAGSDARELTPFNSYLKAIEEAIAAWDQAIDVFGAQWLRDAYQMDVYVLGRDNVPTAAITDPDIVVVTDESEGGVLGTAYRLTSCVARISKLEIESFSYVDMYNVGMHEFGHCLGLQHIGSQGGVDPASAQKHPEHDVMNGFYSHWIGEKGTHRHCISNLNVLGLEFVFSHTNRSPLLAAGPGKTIKMPVGAYGDTCAPPPRDWRELTAGRSTPSPQPPSEPVGEPEVAPSSVIAAPANGASLPRSRFRRVVGSAEGDGLNAVGVAVARKSDGRCAWWNAAKRRFVRRSCSRPLWQAASGTTSWSFRVRSVLPGGRYMALSRAKAQDAAEACCELGKNQVQFRLR